MKKLTKDSFMDEVCEYGLFSELIPECFYSERLAQKWKGLQTKVKGGCPSAPASLSVYKDGQARRVVGAPNPHAFMYLAKYIHDNWNIVVRLAKSSHSQSPITFCVPYDLDDARFPEDEERINSINLRDSLGLRSDFVQSIKDRIRKALGYKYKLSLDLATFYDSIYTHALVWAVCGKKDTKDFFVTSRSNDPAIKASIPKPPDYDFANQMDIRMRGQRLEETSGIITGPYTSRIFSEIMLACIDSEIEVRLHDMGLKAVFSRYVDDYSFYFRSRGDAERAITIVEDVLSEYRLKINHSKTTIAEYPFDLLDNMKTRFEEAYGPKDNPSMFGLLNEANLMKAEGQKGAHKYALKICQRKKIGKDEADLVLSVLFNITLTNPSYGRYVLRTIENNRDVLDGGVLTDALNTMIEQELEMGLQQECAFLLNFAKLLRVQVSGQNILNAIQARDDFSRILALDFWRNQRKQVSSDYSTSRKINKAISNLADELSTETMDGEHWLLMYEARMHHLIDGIDITKGKTGPFFELLEEYGISFYDGFTNGRSQGKV